MNGRGIGGDETGKDRRRRCRDT